MVLNVILWLVFGAVAGWVASTMMKTSNTLTMNIILGIVGSVIAGFIARLLGIYTDGFSLVALLIAIVGAMLLIFLVRKVK